MSTPIPVPAPINLDQQRKRARALLRDARAGEASALARMQAVRTDAGTATRPLRLADAQLAIARENGFASWPALVTAVETHDIKAFGDALRAGDVPAATHLLARAHVQRRLNDPVFDFGQRALHLAARNAALLTLLLDAGADPQLKSTWDNGPYTVLDHADEHTARLLLQRGATLTPNAAARLGWFDDLRRLIDADPTLVHSRGGDGQQPLHEAATVAIADFLLDCGAAIDARCIDHHSTPAQYALADRPDVCRRLLDRGATPDIFMAARLGDDALATRLIDDDPACVAARVNAPGYAAVPPFNIYCWTLGFDLSPHDVARKFGHHGVRDLLAARSPGRVRLMNAILAGDAAAVRVIDDEDPSLLASLVEGASGHLAHAIFHEHFDAADLMLQLGFDPNAPGVDGGSALHAACWVGSVRLVDLLLARGGIRLDTPDPTHGSTPLGWAAFGSVHRRARGADYPAVVERLVAAGADLTVAGNRTGTSLASMAQGNRVVQETLRRLGAH